MAQNDDSGGEFDDAQEAVDDSLAGQDIDQADLRDPAREKERLVEELISRDG